MNQAQSGLVGKQTQPPPHHIVCLECWERLELGFESDYQRRNKTVLNRGNGTMIGLRYLGFVTLLCG